MQLANQEAQRFNHEYFGTEHILLGLIRVGGGAASVLNNRVVDLQSIRLEVERLVQKGPDIVTTGKLPQTPAAKRVIEYSLYEARDLKHSYVATEHVLLGLLREQEGVAAQVLMNLGFNLEEVREELLNLLSSGSAEAAQNSAPMTPSAPMREFVVAKINLEDLDAADARRKPSKVIASRNSSTGKSPGLLLFAAGMVVGWLLCWLILG